MQKIQAAQASAVQSRALQFAAINSKLNSDSPDVHVTLAWVYFKLNRFAEASNELKEGLQRGTLTTDSTYLVAEMLSAQPLPEQKDAAKRLLAEALKNENQDIFIHRKDAEDLLKKLGGA